MKRRIFFGILIGSLFGCREKLTEAPKSISPQQNSDQKPFAPTVDKVANEPKVKPSVWLPPLEKYEKPEKKEKWFRPRIHDGGGVAVDCNDCGLGGIIPCEVCNGRGYLISATGLRDANKAWINKKTSCFQCGGKGGFSCTTCGGTGFLKERG